MALPGHAGQIGRAPSPGPGSAGVVGGLVAVVLGGGVLGSGRVVGILLIGFSLIVGIGAIAWLLVSSAWTGGKVLGLVLLTILILPVLGAGIFMLFRGQAEVKDWCLPPTTLP